MHADIFIDWKTMECFDSSFQQIFLLISLTLIWRILSRFLSEKGCMNIKPTF